ncbi:MAG: hypothetical protein GY792_31240, partial [Gammaproteobacteria bacterium]|nr:hypothetical protein [Gammaproteobacteria bacterium]
MTRKRKKRSQKEGRHRSVSAVNPNPYPLQKRRLPAPKGSRSRVEARQALSQARRSNIDPGQNPFVCRIVELLHDVTTASTINPYHIWTDWIGMIEAGLRAQAENNKKIMLEGTIIEDPPEVAVIFSRARERYLRASEQNPAVYRKMQDAFGISFALLMQAASYGLEFYLEHLEYSPDIIGQVFR